jgi:hypothetical protein
MERTVHYDLNHTVGAQIIADDLLKFFTNITGNCFSTAYQVSMQESRIDLIHIAVEAFRLALPDEPPAVTDYLRYTRIVTKSAFLTIDDGYNYDLWTTGQTRQIVLNLHGKPDAILQIMTTLKANIPVVKVPIVTWEYIAGNQRRSQNIKLEPAKPIFKEFYPWIDDVRSYFDRFLASEESVLVLLGETGTAKTSFIRSMIWHANLTTMFTYEEMLLETDGLFVDLICNERTNLLVIEDADVFITSREHTGNKIMSKFLNVSDGLASGTGRKKIIFTANITEPNRIDSALLRAGRCFDCMSFRRLTYPEACAAAKVAEIPIPSSERDYTLAELFAYEKRNRHATVRSVGFQT